MKRLQIELERIMEHRQPVKEIFHILQMEYRPEDSLETLYKALIRVQELTRIKLIQNKPISEQVMQIVQCFKRSSCQNGNIDVVVCVK